MQAPSNAVNQWNAYAVFGQTLRNFDGYIQDVRTVVSGVRGRLPRYADPILEKLDTQIDAGTTKHAKYQQELDRNAPRVVWQAYARTVKLQEITSDVQQLMQLLTACLADPGVVSGALAGILQRAARLDHSSAHATQLLTRLWAAMNLLQNSSASATDVDAALRDLESFTLELSQREQHTVRQTVQQVCSGVQAMLQPGLETGMDGLSEAMRSMEDNLRALFRDEIRVLGEQVAAVEDRVNINSTRIQELQQRIERKDAEELANTTEPADFARVIPAFMKAVRAGEVELNYCVVEQEPFGRSGELEPVKLPCGCTVSRRAAETLRARGRCALCRRPIPTDSDLDVDHRVLRIVQMSMRGLDIPKYSHNDISMQGPGEGGSGGGLQAGLLVASGRRVALKVVPLPPALSGTDEAALRQSVMTTYIAGDHNPAHICKMLGVSWSEDELWLVMEKCDGKLTAFVKEKAEECGAAGLGVADVLALGWMLLDAVNTMHGHAKALHLDIKPGNVFLVPSRHWQAGRALQSVKLFDSGLTVRLPSRMTGPRSTFVEVGRPGDSAYAPPEQHDMKARRASDVYAVGATMLFAATGQHPYGDSTSITDIVKAQLLGRPMPIPESVDAGLHDLIASMTALEADVRPKCADAQSRILALYAREQEAGASAAFLSPYWGMPGPAGPSSGR